jgi:hypothetical protein
MGRRFAPICCDDNTLLGFVLATETAKDGDQIFGTKFQMTIVDAVGVSHIRTTDRCPACGRSLRDRSFLCVPIDAWIPLEEMK